MKTLTMISAFGLSCLLLLTACNDARTAEHSTQKQMQKENTHMPISKTIRPEEFHPLKETYPNLVLIDVRTEEEYAEKHLPDARLIPLDTIQNEPLKDISFDTPIVLYCRSGQRSAAAASRLSAIGYTQIYDLGGINRWPYETISGK